MSNFNISEELFHFFFSDVLFLVEEGLIFVFRDIWDNFINASNDGSSGGISVDLMGSVHTVRSHIWVEFAVNCIEVEWFSDLALAEYGVL